MEYKVVEKFVSINGEGKKAGMLAIFIRFAGCNLCCSYCDTMWANQKDVEYDLMTEDEIAKYVLEEGIKNVTLTGGEPLLQKDIDKLIAKLTGLSINVEIETNGSVDLEPFMNITPTPSFTMDYKLPGSLMEDRMNKDNFRWLTKKDTVKFVAGSKEDLLRTKEIIEEFNLTEKCSVYISPVFGKISLSSIVDFMKDNKLNDVNMQLQMHKIIWDPNQKGV